MVVVRVEVFVVQVVSQHGVPEGFCGQAGIDAGLVEGQRIRGSEHSDIGEDGRVIFGVAVAGRRDVHDERDVEAVATADDGLGVLGHLGVEDGERLVLGEVDRIEVAGAKAAAATYAVAFVHLHLAFYAVEHQAAVGAFLLAAAASPALVFVDGGLSGRMLVLLAGAGAAAHSDILDGTAEAGHLVPFEVGQADEDVGIHDGASDQGFLRVLAALHGDGNVIGTFQTVGDNDRAAG